MLGTPAFAQTEGASVADALMGLLQVALVVAFLVVLFRASRARRRPVTAKATPRRPPSATDDDVRAAYDRGLLDLNSGPKIGGPGAGLFFLMPYAVRAVRDGGFTGGIVRYPAYDSLTQSERTAVRIIHLGLVASNKQQIGAWFAKTGMVHTLLDPACSLLDLERNQEAAPMDREILQLDLRKPHAELSQTLTYPAYMITYVCSQAGLTDRPPRQGPDVLAGGEEFLSELEALNDPEVWHLIVAGFNYDLEITWRALDWIVRRPECDAGTAALAFLRLHGSDYVGQEIPDLGPPATSSLDAAAIVARICLRSEGEWFARAELSLRCVDEDDDQRPLLATLLAREGDAPATGRIPVPRRLLAHVFDGRPPDTPYRVEPDDVVWRAGAPRRILERSAR